MEKRIINGITVSEILWEDWLKPVFTALKTSEGITITVDDNDVFMFSTKYKYTAYRVDDKLIRDELRAIAN